MDAILSLLLTDLPSILPAIIVAILLGYGGRYAVPMVRALPDSRWRRLYLLTDWLHPVLLGALAGCSPHLPVPAWMTDSWEGSILWYALAGVVSVPIYQGLMKRLAKEDACGVGR